MSLREKHFNFSEVIGWFGAAIAASITATWILATHLQSNELASYKAAESWRPLETIEALREASKSVNLATNERRELVMLRAENESSKDLAGQVKILTEQRDQLTATLASITASAQEVSVSKGSSQFLIPNILLLGVARTNSLSNECAFIIDNRNESLQIGKGIHTTAAGINYNLRLIAVTDSSCSFSFTKNQENPDQSEVARISRTG